MRMTDFQCLPITLKSFSQKKYFVDLVIDIVNTLKKLLINIEQMGNRYFYFDTCRGDIFLKCMGILLIFKD